MRHYLVIILAILLIAALPGCTAGERAQETVKITERPPGTIETKAREYTAEEPTSATVYSSDGEWGAADISGVFNENGMARF